MPTLKLIIRYALTFPGDALFAWPIVLLIRALWGRSLAWQSGALVVELAPTSWPMRTWYKPWGGTTFGHGIMLAPNQLPITLSHELVHVEQIEGAAIAGFVLGAVSCSVLSALGWWWVGLIVGGLTWPFTPALAYGCASLAAWLRSEPGAYTGNVMEEGARAISGSGCQTAPYR